MVTSPQMWLYTSVQDSGMVGMHRGLQKPKKRFFCQGGNRTGAKACGPPAQHCTGVNPALVHMALYKLSSRNDVVQMELYRCRCTRCSCTDVVVRSVEWMKLLFIFILWSWQWTRLPLFSSAALSNIQKEMRGSTQIGIHHKDWLRWRVERKRYREHKVWLGH